MKLDNGIRGHIAVNKGPQIANIICCGVFPCFALRPVAKPFNIGPYLVQGNDKFTVGVKVPLSAAATYRRLLMLAEILLLPPSLSLHPKRVIANRTVVSNKIKDLINDFIFLLHLFGITLRRFFPKLETH